MQKQLQEGARGAEMTKEERDLDAFQRLETRAAGEGKPVTIPRAS